MSSRRAVSVQLSIQAPKGTPHDIIKQAILHKCETGEDTPAIEIRVIDWTGRNGRPFDSDEAFSRLKGPIAGAVLRVRKDRQG